LKILVTGANGPLGQAVRDLAASSENCHDFLFTGSKELELTDMDAVNKFFQFERPDFVFHLAAKSGGANLNKLIPVDMFEKNMKMSMNILGAAAKIGVKKTILVSSTSAYPALRQTPACETDLNAGPPSATDYPYAYAKRMMDPLARAYRDQYGMQVSVAIVNGIVGPYMNFRKGESVMLAGLIRRFYEQQKFGNPNDPFLVQGDGTPVREYTYSFDLAKALLWMVGEQDMPELINIGNSQGLSVREYAEIVCNCLDIDPHKLTFAEPRGSQTPMYNQLTNNLYFKKLSNFDFTDSKSAIKMTIDWFRNNYEMIAECG
jgi:GDP-L-fucose synthase